MVPKPQLCSGQTMGLVPWASACYLPGFPFCLRPGALFSCSPRRWPVESPTRPPGHHPAGPGRHCPLGKAPGQSCLMLLCRVRVGRGPLPWLACAPHPSSPQPSPPPSPPLALAAAHFSAVEPAHWALKGVIWLPLVSERIILSVDCPFL